MQIYDDTTIPDAGLDFSRLFRKRVRLEGEPFAQHTAHQHRPLVLAVKKATLIK